MVDNAIALHWRKYPERYLLRGSHCLTCKSEYFPSRLFCPNCRRKGKLVSKEMPRTGTITSFTKVSVGPIGFEHQTPYYLALIDLGNNCTILSQVVDSPEEKVKIGAKVKKMFRKIQDTNLEGAIAYGYKFKVV